MATLTRLDTHVVVWLYAGEVERFSAPATQRLQNDELVITPIVELELTYLHEIGRLTVPAAVVVADLRQRLGLTLSTQDMDLVVAAATPLDWTRDPFDRLIVGDALSADSVLLTKDAAILEHCRSAEW